MALAKKSATAATAAETAATTMTATRMRLNNPHEKSSFYDSQHTHTRARSVGKAGEKKRKKGRGSETYQAELGAASKLEISAAKISGMYLMDTAAIFIVDLLLRWMPVDTTDTVDTLDTVPQL